MGDVLGVCFRRERATFGATLFAIVVILAATMVAAGACRAVQPDGGAIRGRRRSTEPALATVGVGATASPTGLGTGHQGRVNYPPPLTSGGGRPAPDQAVPPQTLTRARPLPTATSMSGAPSATENVPTPVAVAISADDVVRLTLAQLWPEGAPRLEFVGVTTLEEAWGRLEGVGGFGWNVGSFDSRLDRVVYVVGATVAKQELWGSGPSASTEEDGRVRFVSIYDAATGRQMYWGAPWSDEGFAELAEGRWPAEPAVTFLPTAAVATAIAADSATATHQARRGYYRSGAPTPSATPVAGPVPTGRPFDPDRASLETLAALEDYPLMPGNRWVYRVDEYEHWLWRGYVFTETVESAALLGSELYLAELALDRRMLNPVGQPPRVWWEQRVASERGFALLWRGELYRTYDAAELAGWVEYFSASQAVPTIAPMYEYVDQQQGRPAPYLVLPVGHGFIAPVVVIGSNWMVEEAVEVETPAGVFEDCARAFHPGNYNGWRWFCHGVGDVRFEFVKGGSANIWSIENLIDVSIAATVGGH